MPLHSKYHIADRIRSRLLGRAHHRSAGASMVEALIALPIVLIACLLTLQMMLLYRAKISLNYATQEAARVGAMSNGRVVPRFLTDVTRAYSAVFRKRPVCESGGVKVPNSSDGNCPSGSSAAADPSTIDSSRIPGGDASADGNEPNGPQYDGNGGDRASDPPAMPNTAEANTGSNAAKAKNFFLQFGKGMMRYGDSSVLQGFINGIMPLYTKGTTVGSIFKAQADAYEDAMMNSCIIYHSPTQAAFLDFGFVEVDGPDKNVLQIPNDLLRYRIPADVDPKGKGINYYNSNGRYASPDEGGLRGKASSMSVQEATLLSIEVKYSYPLQVPIAREIMVGIAKLSNFGSKETAMGQAFDNYSLNNGRWPMSGFSTYRMQTPVHWNIFYPFGNVSNITNTPIEAFTGIQALWNLVLSQINTNLFDPNEPQIGFCPGLLMHVADDSIHNDGVKKNIWVGKDYDTKLY